MRADGTVLDLLPVGRTIGISGILLVALFTLIKPEASHGLGVAGRLLFWLLHVGLGFAALWIASRWLAHGGRLPYGTLAAVLISGCAAIVIAAPAYLLLDALFANHTLDLDPDPPVAWPLRLVREVVELGPWVMLAWLIINLPVLLPQRATRVEVEKPASPVSEVQPPAVALSDADTIPAEASASKPVPVKPPVDVNPSASGFDAVQSESEPAQKHRFLLSLPGIVGTDIVAVSSDLHYLNVWTAAGRSTVLGSLRDVVADLGDTGMQVHRSHWVAHAHVRRIVGTANNASCILSNELRVPISRRRWKSVREYYGRGVVHATRGLER